MKHRGALVWLLAAALLASGCGAASGTSEWQQQVDAQQPAETGGSATPEATTEQGDAGQTEQADTAGTAADSQDMFTDRDFEIGFDEQTSVQILLTGDGAACTSDAVQISGSTVLITQEGTYVLSGTLDDGMVAVNAPDTAKVHLVLNGVSISNATSAALYVMEADKVFVTTVSGTENTLQNGGAYVAIDDNNIDGVIFSKADLTLNGAGTLVIAAEAGHGVVSKDDLVLTSGTYAITAAGQGLSGKDSVRIANGSYTIISGKDAIHAENADDASLGFLYISGGTFTIDAEGDGMSAASTLQITDGTFDISTGAGSASATMKTDAADFGRWQAQAQTQSQAAETEETSTSQKGIKAGTALTILDGSFQTDTVDDSLHAGGDIQIAGGTFDLRSGDDAIHSDAAVRIAGGEFTISYCYEGIEGLSVTVDAGTFDITSEDDGLNAAGGADSSGFGGGRPGQDRFSADSDSFITINGGAFAIVSRGDCIDSNGALTISGGTLDLTCNGNGNTALDCDGTYTNTGGDVTTNDGSEANPGQMGGGMGRPGGQGGPGGQDRGGSRP